jgi:hypothetical protein
LLEAIDFCADISINVRRRKSGRRAVELAHQNHGTKTFQLW